MARSREISRFTNRRMADWRCATTGCGNWPVKGWTVCAACLANIEKRPRIIPQNYSDQAGEGVGK